MPFAKIMSRDQRVCNATSNTPQRDPRDRHRREIPHDTTIALVATEFSFLLDVSRSRRTETSIHEQTVYLYRCLSLFFLVLRLNWTTLRSGRRRSFLPPELLRHRLAESEREGRASEKGERDARSIVVIPMLLLLYVCERAVAKRSPSDG